MSPRIRCHSIAFCIVAAAFAGCDNKPQSNSNVTGKPAQDKKTYKIALIAKSQGNQVFQAARVGAEDAAMDLSAKLGVQIVIESTGLFTEAEKAKGHLAAGAKKLYLPVRHGEGKFYPANTAVLKRLRQRHHVVLQYATPGFTPASDGRLNRW